MSFRFSWVLIFLVIHFIIWIYWYFKQKDQDFIFQNSSKKVRDTIKTNLDDKLIRWRNRIIFGGIIFLTLAAAGPQIGTRVRPVERKGVDLVIALDTSISMDSKDVTPSRLELSLIHISEPTRPY